MSAGASSTLANRADPGSSAAARRCGALLSQRHRAGSVTTAVIWSALGETPVRSWPSQNAAAPATASG